MSLRRRLSQKEKKKERKAFEKLGEGKFEEFMKQIEELELTQKEIDRILMEKGADFLRKSREGTLKQMKREKELNKETEKRLKEMKSTIEDIYGKGSFETYTEKYREELQESLKAGENHSIARIDAHNKAVSNLKELKEKKN